MPSAVIFDCDGVLFDSWRANIAYYNAIRVRVGLDPMDEAWERRAHVLAAAQVVDEMFGADATLLQRARDVARTISYEPFYDLMTPMPGLHDVLATLHGDHRLAMATNRGSTVLEVVRRFDLGRWLDTAVGVLDVARPKPAPDMLELVLSRLGVAPDAAVYVGDSASDLRAAAAAGTHFVGIGAHTGGERTVEALGDVPAAVRTILPPPGIVVAVSRSGSHTMAKPVTDAIRLVAGLGVEGDAHLGATVQHRSRVAQDPTRPNLRQVHLIHTELHDELHARGFAVAAGQMGENVTTRGIDLLALPAGTRLHLGGAAIVQVTGLRNPCAQLDGIRPGLMAAVLDRDDAGGLLRKAGVMAIVLAGGEVRPGDPIRVELPPAPHRPLAPV